MKIFFKIFAAVAVLAGLVLLAVEIMRRRDEDDKRKSDRALRRLVRERRDAGQDTIADYRYDDDDDEFFTDFDNADDAVSADDIDDEPAEDTFYLSEDALEQLLDS